MATILRFLGYNLPIISDADLARIDATVDTDTGCPGRQYIRCTSCGNRRNVSFACMCGCK
jgi:hypothetical protein